ncbi:hypothetical protein H6788_00095 [Candidatus Nomurabacteria bacterium]|nr:hypothetical protein [Candidatus Nomurabacteria bacterium]MCB9819254.1 hypothetical protein [Candidatus Nomurabacteria bacterium]
MRILYVGDKSYSDTLRDRLDREVYKVDHLKGEMALMMEFGAPYVQEKPNMVICEIHILGSELKTYIDLVNFVRDSYPALPIILLDNSRPGVTIGSLGDNVWLFISDEIDSLAKHIRKVFAPKH